MKITVTEGMFKNQFKVYGCEDNFSSVGLSALFDYFEECEQDVREELELDVIAICCDFTEGDTDSIASDYDIDLSECEGLEDRFNMVLDYLESETFVIYSDEDAGTILYANF